MRKRYRRQGIHTPAMTVIGDVVRSAGNSCQWYGMRRTCPAKSVLLTGTPAYTTARPQNGCGPCGAAAGGSQPDLPVRLLRPDELKAAALGQSYTWAVLTSANGVETTLCIAMRQARVDLRQSAAPAVRRHRKRHGTGAGGPRHFRGLRAGALRQPQPGRGADSAADRDNDRVLCCCERKTALFMLPQLLEQAGKPFDTCAAVSRCRPTGGNGNCCCQELETHGLCVPCQCLRGTSLCGNDGGRSQTPAEARCNRRRHRERQPQRQRLSVAQTAAQADIAGMIRMHIAKKTRCRKCIRSHCIYRGKSASCSVAGKVAQRRVWGSAGMPARK